MIIITFIVCLVLTIWLYRRWLQRAFQQPIGSTKPVYKLENELDDKDGCEHYRLKCWVQAPCCEDLFWGCWRCHDEGIYEGMRVNEVLLSPHRIDRTTINVMKCRYCKTIQEVGKTCQGCGLCMAQYYCDQCHYFNDAPTSPIFHCDECGICRVGKRKDYRHCVKCGICISDKIGEHACFENAGKEDCPICLESLFHSREIPRILPCGHILHEKCLYELCKIDFKCPICLKSLGDETERTNSIDAYLSRIPSIFNGPEIECFCNNCEIRFQTTSNITGYYKCTHCHQYNTTHL
ncbi:hypothetical protein K7432_009827 [Basidiobolus ranarum]|uniref:Uncharacterized protein n=1 Tax=Basidiobolus ranarum TaxID=34480 RepID=A0ABR2VWF5_9FUNG